VGFTNSAGHDKTTDLQARRSLRPQRYAERARAANERSCVARCWKRGKSGQPVGYMLEDSGVPTLAALEANELGGRLRLAHERGRGCVALLAYECLASAAHEMLDRVGQGQGVAVAAWVSVPNTRIPRVCVVVGRWVGSAAVVGRSRGVSRLRRSSSDPSATRTRSGRSTRGRCPKELAQASAKRVGCTNTIPLQIGGFAQAADLCTSRVDRARWPDAARHLSRR
jgi:hypothetical protein